MNNEREYRSFSLIERTKTEEPDYICEGYASTFEPYVLFRDEEADVDYVEQIDPHAFDEADMSDCVFRVDHMGPVYARVSAGTVKLDIDDKGLHQVADLSKTASARALHEDIVAGNYPQMSFSFTIAESHVARDAKEGTITRIIDRVAKVFDISPVTWPANPTTSLSARSNECINGEIEALKAERLELERRQKALERFKKLTQEDIQHD